MKKQLIRTIALTLAVIIMLCPLCVCFASADPVPTPSIPPVLGSEELYRELIYFYIWQTLNSWGINISYSDFVGFTGDIGDWIDENLEAWLDTIPSINSIDALLFPWKFVWNPSGYLVGNHSALDDIRAFGDWLVSEYNLSDNQNKPLGRTGDSIGEMVVYKLPLAVNYTASNNITYDINWAVYIGDSNTYAALMHNNSGLIDLKFISRNSGVTVRKITHQSNNSTTTTDFILDYIRNGWYVKDQNNFASPGYFNGMVSYTRAEVNSYLDANNDVTNYTSNMYILTNTIDVPTTQETDGNSIVITPSGPIYEPVEWDGSVSVDNLPAIVSTGSIRTLDLVSVFAPIKAFANTFSDGFDLMVQIIYNMPTAIVSIALTIMAAIAVFGTIKIFKEH